MVSFWILLIHKTLCFSNRIKMFHDSAEVVLTRILRLGLSTIYPWNQPSF